MASAALLATGLLGVAACGDDDGGTNNVNNVNTNNNNNENTNDNNNNNTVTPPEICGDASDNDGDGFTDCRDTDCAAEPACTLAFTILQTSDLHNHAAGYSSARDYTPLTTGDDDTTSGYARLATVIGTVKAQKAATSTPVLLFDGGDFLSGTLFDLAVDDPISLKFFQLLGYTAITIGNHDTDWAPNGLAMLYHNAMLATPAFAVPVVQTNLVFDATATGDDNLAALETAGLIQRKLVVDLPNGLKVGILGKMGDDSSGVAKMASPLTWEAVDPAGAGYGAYWQGKVDDLRNTDGVDIVIMISHSHFQLSGTSEDRTLATMVDGIDFIAAGHSHVLTATPVVVGKTMIFEPGRYGEHVAQVDATYNLATRTVDSSALIMHAVDDTVTGDATVAGMVDMYIAGLDAVLLDSMGVGYASPLAQLSEDFDITMVEDVPGETQFGNLCADAFRAVATITVFQQTENAPFDVAVVPAGVIRDGLFHGNTGIISFADAFAALPTGASPYDTTIPGWPLVSIYLTAAELRDAAEVNSLVSSGMTIPAAQLYFSGMRYKYNPAGAMFNQVWEVSLCGNALRQSYGGQGDFFSLNCSELDITAANTELYRVVVDLYTLYSLGLAASASFGNLSIVPKKADGTEVDLTDGMSIMGTLIDRDSSTGGIQELKEWMTLPGFFTNWTHIGAFTPGANLLPQIPEAIYGATGTAFGRAISAAP